MSKRSYQAEYDQRMKDKGNCKVCVWVAWEWVERLKKYAKRLRAK